MTDHLDPTPDAVATFGQWCRDNGFDPVSRTYSPDPTEALDPDISPGQVPVTPRP